MRRPVNIKRIIKPDPEFKSETVAKFTNYLMVGGKKNTARKVVHDAFAEIKATEKKDPLEVFETAIKNVEPLTEIKARRIGSAVYQVPREVPFKRRLALAMRWIIGAAASKKGMPMAKRLANELILASKNEGEAVKKRENIHKMAEANRAFAHFAW